MKLIERIDLADRRRAARGASARSDRPPGAGATRRPSRPTTKARPADRYRKCFEQVMTARGVYEHPKGSGFWWIHYYDHGRRHRERIGARALAIAVREKRRTEIREGRYFPAARRRAALFDDLLREYREAKEREGKEVQRGEYGYRRLLEEFGGRRADVIAARDVEALRDRLMETLAPASVVRHLSLLRAILNSAIRDGRLATLPTRGVKWPKENNRRVRCLAD